jgi:hypothetical protein
VVPHTGGWDEAQISRENGGWNEPMLAQIVDGPPGNTAHTRSLVSVSGRGVEIPTLLFQGRSLLVRLFNGEGDAEERTISLDVRPLRVDVVELDGRAVRQLEVRPGSGGRYEVKLSLPRFGIRTLRCEMAAAAG